MRLFLSIIILFLLNSCAQEPKVKTVYIFVNSEAIEYFTAENTQTQLVKSTYSNGQELITDSTIVIKTYNAGNLTEQIEYNLENGDSIFRRYIVKEYNKDDFLITEKDSVEGFFSNKSKYYYKDGKGIRAERSDILYHSDFENDTIKIIGTDTLQSIVYSYYDERGNCIATKAVSLDNLFNKVDKKTNPDTTISYHSYDERDNRVKTISINSGDTTSVYTAQYNEFNKVVANIDKSKEFGTTSMSYEYDINGNKFTEVIIIDGIPERTDYKYDSANRVIRSTTYRAKETLVNNSYE